MLIRLRDANFKQRFQTEDEEYTQFTLSTSSPTCDVDKELQEAKLLNDYKLQYPDNESENQWRYTVCAGRLARCAYLQYMQNKKKDLERYMQDVTEDVKYRTWRS